MLLQSFKNDNQLMNLYSGLGDEGLSKKLAWETFNRASKDRKHGISFQYIATDAKDRLISLACDIAKDNDEIDIVGVVEQLVMIADNEKIPFIRLLDYDIDTLTKRVVDTYVTDNDIENNEYEV